MVRSLIGLGLLAILAAGLGADRVLAQTDKAGEPPIFAPGEQDRTDSQFRLFGDRDFAVSGLRMVGDFTGCTNNGGNISTPDQCWNNFHPEQTLFQTDWFDIFFYWAAPPSEWLKHQATVPSLGNAAGKGYTVNSALTQYQGEILPHDGGLGPEHAGVTDTGDGACTDYRTITTGNPLLAGSDCPPTWGSAGWGGTRFVDQDGFIGYADQVGDASFSFDDWKVPDELHRNDKFLGTFQTYGYFSDYSVEALFGSALYPSYGNVIPESMGGDPATDPGRTGWPLGLLAKMDAFSFAAPGLSNTAWFEITVTNNSRDVYGVGLDYDSLYMGLQPGWLQQQQGSALYRDPANGVVRGATMCQGFTGPIGCGPNSGDPMHSYQSWGSAPPGGVGAGFNYGAAAIVVMKSPIGDLRNKKFTDPADAFFGKGDPEIWDDTVTFNHGHMCGFHGCSAVLWNASVNRPPLPATDYEQRQFGMVASVVSDVLGDRALGDIADHTMWDTFRWEEFPDRNQLDFNRWTPVGWDYDNDGLDDVLSYDDCTDNSGGQLDPFTGNTKSCSVSWSDTLPGGFGNVYANRAAVTGSGPFPLPADSTVQFIVALVHANDLASIEADIARAIDHYNAFFLGPEPAPAPTVTSIDVAPGGGTANPSGPAAEVTIYFDDMSETWEDPFLAKFLADMLAADPETELGQIRQLNPFLVDTLVALIPNNVQFIHVFKSCDSGGTFTDDADCFADPAAGDGLFASLGWLPWMTLEASEDGSFPNIISDDGIFGGRQFLYSLLTETRGLTVSVQTGVPGDASLDAGTEDVGTGDGVADAFTGNLSSTPVVPSTVTITDGTQTVTDDGAGNLVGDVNAGGTNTIDYATGEYDVTFAAAPALGAAIEVTYQYTFFTCVADCSSQILEVAPKLTPAIATSTGAANVAAAYIPVSNQPGSEAPTITVITESPDFIPFSRMGVSATRTQLSDGEYGLRFGDQVVVTEVAIVSATGSDVLETMVEVTDASGTTTLTAPGAVGVEGSYTETSVADTVTRVWTFTDLTAVLTDGDEVPLTVTSDLTGGQTVPGRYFGLGNFPGFTFSVDNGLGGSFEGQFYLDANGEQFQPLVEPAVTFLEGQAGGVATEDRYRVTWSDEAFGSGSPFFLNFSDPDATRELVVQSLEGRQAGSTATTDPDVASFIGLPVEALLPARLPFVIENVTDEDNPTPVAVVLTQANKVSTLELGIGLDTVNVDIPATEWVPGDVLMLVEGSAPDFNVTFGTAIIGCRADIWQRTTCNPVTVSSPGATGYIPNGADQELHFGYYQTITSETGYTFSVTSAMTGEELLATSPEAIRAQLDSVKVVPNPFVMYSRYSTDENVDRVIFTHVPPRGVLRVFTVAGQFVQQLTWEPDDLNDRGDLWFNLRTQEGLEMAAGLYLFVLDALDENDGKIGTAKGKFVLIK